MEKKRQLPSLQLKAEDFLPVEAAARGQHRALPAPVGYWKSGLQRLVRDPLAMAALAVIALVLVFSFVLPMFYPYSYAQQIRGSEDLPAMGLSAEELARRQAGEAVFPHLLGTDGLGRDLMARLMAGSRISLTVGLVASTIILVIGSVYGAVAGYFGGKVDMVMMRIVDVIYTVPDVLIIILLMVTLKYPLQRLAQVPGFGWIDTLGAGLISIFIVFALLYWVGMARIVRSQILMLKEQEYVTAARALGAGHSRIIRTHLLTNCIGTLIVTTTLQIPSAIFTESFLSFLGLGVSAPMPSLGSLAADAIDGIYSYPLRLLAPAALISLIILAFNLFGDGVRDAFDPKLRR